MENQLDSSTSNNLLNGETFPTEAQGGAGINTSIMSDDIRKIQLKDEETKFLYDEI